jgi:hypothetical protein
VRFIGRLVERVADAFVENFLGIVGSRRTFWTRNRIRQPELLEKLTEIDWVILNVEFLLDKMLYLLFFQGCPSRRSSRSSSCSS